MRTVYSYQRFSSLEQADGDSIRRQMDGASAWCARHQGFTLDTMLTLRDKGRSGFRGKHIGRLDKDGTRKGKGALGAFLNYIKAGVIKPGSVLLVENLDRMGRMQIKESLDIAKEILEAGVDIVTFCPEDWYTRDGLNDTMQWMKLVWYFQRAHDESKMKSERSKSNWGEKRKAIAEGKPVTAVRPFWIDIIQDGKLVGRGRGKVNWAKPVEFNLNDKAEIVRHIFNLAENVGVSRITADLYKRGYKIGRADAPTHCTLIRLLTNRQVMGEYMPHYGKDENDKRAAAGEAVPDYYPKVIEPAQFYRIQEKIKKRKRGGRGRKSNMPNLFGGLLIDARDGQSMVLMKSRNKHALVSVGARNNRPGSVWIEFNYALLERSLLRCCRELPIDFLSPDNPATQTVTKLEGELAELRDKIERAQGKLDAAVDEAEEEVYAGQMARLIRKRKDIEAALDKAKGDVSTQPQDQLRQLQSLAERIETVPDEERLQTRTLVAGLLASVIDKIYLWVQRRGPKTRCKKRAWVWVIYKNGKRRKLFIDGESGCVVTVGLDENEPMTPEWSQIGGGDGWE